MRLPAMAAKREGRDPASVVPPGESESRMNEVRRMMDKFEKEQTELYMLGIHGRGRHRFMTTDRHRSFLHPCRRPDDLFHLYSYFLCRRQLKKVASADIRIQSVIDQILDGMITIDEKGKVYSMNPAAKQMFGYAEGEPFAADFTELIPEYFSGGTDSPGRLKSPISLSAPARRRWRWLAAAKAATPLFRSSFR